MRTSVNAVFFTLLVPGAFPRKMTGASNAIGKRIIVPFVSLIIVAGNVSARNAISIAEKSCP